MMETLPSDIFFLICEYLDGVSADYLCRNLPRFLPLRGRLHQRMKKRWDSKLACFQNNSSLDITMWGIYYDQWDAILSPKELSGILKHISQTAFQHRNSATPFFKILFPEIRLPSRRMLDWLEDTFKIETELIARDFESFCSMLTGSASSYTSFMRKVFLREDLPDILAMKQPELKSEALLRYRESYPIIYYGYLHLLQLPSGSIYQIIMRECKKLAYFKTQQEVIDRLYSQIKNQAYERKLKAKYPSLKYP